MCTATDSATPPSPPLLNVSPTHKRGPVFWPAAPSQPFASSISSIGEKLVLAARYNCWPRLHTYYIRMLYTYEYWPVVITAVRAHYTRHLEPLTYSPWLLLTFDPLGICYATDFQRIFCKSTKFRGTRSDSTYALIAGVVGPERGHGDMCVCLWLCLCDCDAQAFEGWNYAAFTSAYHSLSLASVSRLSRFRNPFPNPPSLSQLSRTSVSGQISRFDQELIYKVLLLLTTLEGLGVVVLEIRIIGGPCVVLVKCFGDLYYWHRV